MSNQIRLVAAMLLLGCYFNIAAQPNGVTWTETSRNIQQEASLSPNVAWSIKINIIYISGLQTTVNVDAQYTGDTPPPGEITVNGTYDSKKRELQVKFAEYEEISMIKSISFSASDFKYSQNGTARLLAQTVTMPQPVNGIVLLKLTTK
jgi:hypothetical protein